MNVGKGFTITELLIVIAVIAILSAIAFPSYQNHVRKAARADAEAELLHIADRETQYLLDARTYTVGATALADLGESLPASVAAKYTIAVHAGDGSDTPSVPPSYLIVATPIPGGPQEPDGNLTLSSTGARTHAGSPGW